MGIMTLEDFRQELNMNLGEHAQPADSRLNVWINRAYLEVAARSNFEALTAKADIVTTECENEYSLPAAAIAVVSIADLTNKRRLLRVALRNMDLQRATDCSRPRVWAQRGTTLIVWPAPRAVATLQVTYITEPAVLSTPTSVTVIPGRYDHLIVLLAARNAWITFRESERATLMHQAAAQYLNDIFEEDELEMGQPSMGIRMNASSWEELTSMDHIFPE